MVRVAGRRRAIPPGLDDDQQPVACDTRSKARVESRGISSSSFPDFASRYAGMNPSRRSNPIVLAEMTVAGACTCANAAIGAARHMSVVIVVSAVREVVIIVMLITVAS